MAMALSSLPPYRLRVEYQDSPLGLGVVAPRFSRALPASGGANSNTATNNIVSTDFYRFLPIFTDFYRFFRLSWETSTFKNYHPEDSEHSGNRRIEFS